jgi:transposase
MLYLLWTGMPWLAMSGKFGKWQTVYDRFAEGKRAGVFEDIWYRSSALG